MKTFTFALIGLVGPTVIVTSSPTSNNPLETEGEAGGLNLTQDTCPVPLTNDDGTTGGKYPQVEEKHGTSMARARSNNRAGSARLFVKMLKRLLKMRFLKRGGAAFVYQEIIKIAANVPLISQNQLHRQKMPVETTDTDADKRSAAHSCWAYARTIALYHSGKFADYTKEEKSFGADWTAWQVAEEMFWNHVVHVRETTNKPKYEGDYAFIPKDKECPNSVKKASTKEQIDMGTDIICDVIEGLMKDSIYILGLGTCEGTTDHYSNVIGFTSNINKDTTFTNGKCVEDQFKADKKTVIGLVGPAKTQLEQKIQTHSNYKKAKEGDLAKKEGTPYQGTAKIFESSCHWKGYCKENLESVKTSFHLIIAEPWCTAEIGGEYYSRMQFYTKAGWENSNCVTGADGNIKKGAEKGNPQASCKLAEKQIVEWKCIKEVPFEIHPAETKKKDSKWNKDCMNKNMLKFTHDKKDVIRKAKACVLGDKDNHWGYAQYLWEVPGKAH